MSFPSLTRPARFGAVAALALLAACDEPLDFDLRGNLGGFTTAPAAQQVTTNRPRPDDRGIISYPNYQVAVARRGDTVVDVANRIGVNPAGLARYNGIEPDVTLRAGEVLALPGRVREPLGGATTAPRGSVDIESLAGDAIARAPDTRRGSVATTSLQPAPAPAPVASGKEPIRHKVVRGETAYTISRLYKVSVKSLAEWNGLGSDFAIREGQFLLIPVASQAPPRRTAAAAPAAIITTRPGSGTPTPTPPSAVTPLPAERVAPAAKPTAPTTSVGKPSKPAATGAMAYPVRGKVIRGYAKGRNDGIDIQASPGTAVTAAAGGTVAAITADADKVPIIVVRHPDNLLTVYANVEGIAVKKGDSVSRGQKLARLRGGDKSYVHFEVRNGFDSVDPTPYLQ